MLAPVADHGTAADPSPSSARLPWQRQIRATSRRLVRVHGIAEMPGAGRATDWPASCNPSAPLSRYRRHRRRFPYKTCPRTPDCLSSLNAASPEPVQAGGSRPLAELRVRFGGVLGLLDCNHLVLSAGRGEDVCSTSR